MIAPAITPLPGVLPRRTRGGFAHAHDNEHEYLSRGRFSAYGMRRADISLVLTPAELSEIASRLALLALGDTPN